ncbi:MAG TPA: hypothetical protein VJR89_10735, partial [Polyangiales bacterium]|nr:hypothetical protein [Polyangiales bacterium]
GSYAFAVSGTVSETSSAKFELKASPLMEATGPGFACQTIQTSCGPQTPPPATTRRTQHVSIGLEASPQIPANEVGQFLFRLVSTDSGTDADRAPYWVPGGLYNFEGSLAVEYRDVRDEYCVELQALRARDLTLQSVGKRCVKYPLPTEPDPAPFNACQYDPAEYARTYCADNAFACSQQNPRAREAAVHDACQYYALVCAPFIGNRTARDRPGCATP